MHCLGGIWYNEYSMGKMTDLGARLNFVDKVITIIEKIFLEFWFGFVLWTISFLFIFMDYFQIFFWFLLGIMYGLWCCQSKWGIMQNGIKAIKAHSYKKIMFCILRHYSKLEYNFIYKKNELSMRQKL